MNSSGTVALVVVVVVVLIWIPSFGLGQYSEIREPNAMRHETEPPSEDGNLIQHANAKGSDSTLLPQRAITAPILMYHYIRPLPVRRYDPIGYNLSIPPSLFELQIQQFALLGYQPIHLADAIQGKGDDKSLILTFDDGYDDFYTTAWPILQKYQWTATIYVITGKVGQPGYLSWEQLKHLQQAGVEIGAHTMSHTDLSLLTREQQWEEIYLSKMVLEQQLATHITTFCYPAGRYTSVTEALVKQAGFLTAVTTRSSNTKNDTSPYLLPRLRIEPDLSLEHLEKQLQLAVAPKH